MSIDLNRDPEFQSRLDKPVNNRGLRLLFRLCFAVMFFGLLFLLLLPARRSAGEAARRAQCVSNLRQIGFALCLYEQEYHAFPPAYTIDSSGMPLHCWRTLILPFIEHVSLYNSIDLTRPWNDPVNGTAMQTSLNVYQCPSMSGSHNFTPYMVVWSPEGLFHHGRSRTKAEITDDPASTIGVVETSEKHMVHWMEPKDMDESVWLNRAAVETWHHPGGGNVLMVDGRVQFIKANVTTKSLRSLLTISGQEPVNLDSY